nr:thialysine N-epsilon-acetyltransferase-like [Anolis sagrei ordinatus]
MGCVIREATVEDCEQIMSLIQEIAAYHHLEHDVTINSEVLKADGFGANSFFKCLLAEQPAENGSKPVRPIGYALYYFGYSVNHGRMLYLENLYVVPELRSKGIGMKLMKKVAEVALAAGCKEIKFVTVEWNQGAKDFYDRMGAHDTTESMQWHCMELGWDSLQRLAGN